MKLSELFEAGRIVDLRDPDHDPEVNKQLAKAEAAGHAKSGEATEKWQALAKYVKAKNPVIKYRSEHSNMSVLSISFGDYYFNTNHHGALNISCNTDGTKFTTEDQAFVKEQVAKAGRELYQIDIGTRNISIGWFNNITEPKFERAVKAIAKRFLDVQKK